MFGHRMPFLARLAMAGLLLGAPAAAFAADDAIVGTWVGDVTQGELTFETRLTFVSATGGISRYPSFPCGGILTGNQQGNDYVYNENITWGGLDERTDGCYPGVMRLTINGSKMKYLWTGTFNGQEFTAEGELQRQKKR
jgi:hypothetical protein